nr:sulfur carrier protein ThiS [uncultured Ruminococcus sp.]
MLGFLKEQGYNIHRIAVERNEKIEAKESYADIQLDDGDVIEVVSFMGGGTL